MQCRSAFTDHRPINGDNFSFLLVNILTGSSVTQNILKDTPGFGTDPSQQIPGGQILMYFALLCLSQGMFYCTLSILSSDVLSSLTPLISHSCTELIVQYRKYQALRKPSVIRPVTTAIIVAWPML